MPPAFAAFRHSNYRLWFTGQLISIIGSWMQNAAQGYLVYTLTGSTTFLGSVSFASSLPAWLFMLYGGVIADRVSRRALIIITQTAMMVEAFLLAGLVFSGLVQPWHILVLAFLSGTASAFEIPARQSLVADLVPREDLTNAIALNVTLFNVGMIAGPAVAGVVYALAGPSWCFTINGVSFLAVIAALAKMALPPRPIPAGKPSALAALREGLAYFRDRPLARMLSLSAFTYNIFDYAMVIFIPAFAVSLLGGDAKTNGLLLAASGAGAVAGGMILAALPGRVGRGKIWIISVTAAPLAIAAFALSRWLPLSLLLTGIIGVTSITVLSNTNTMVQSTVPDEMRGRVMSLYSLLMLGSGPLASLALGALADRSSTLILALTCAGLALAFAGWAWTGARKIREIR